VKKRKEKKEQTLLTSHPSVADLVAAHNAEIEELRTRAIVATASARALETAWEAEKKQLIVIFSEFQREGRRGGVEPKGQQGQEVSRPSEWRSVGAVDHDKGLDTVSSSTPALPIKRKRTTIEGIDYVQNTEQSRAVNLSEEVRDILKKYPSSSKPYSTHRESSPPAMWNLHFTPPRDV